MDRAHRAHGRNRHRVVTAERDGQRARAQDRLEIALRALEGAGGIAGDDVAVPFDDFDLDREWVFNGADIDSQKIVWARDMGSERNRELLDYYRGRKFWEVKADGDAEVKPYGEN